MNKEFVFEKVDKKYDYSLTINKSELNHTIKKPVLEIVLKNGNERYTNRDVCNLFTRIGYFKDGNDVDDTIRDDELIEKVYEHFGLCIQQNGNSIYFDLPYVSLIYGLNTSRIEYDLKFYLTLNNNSKIYSNIYYLKLSLTFDPNDNNSVITLLTETLNDNEQVIIKTSESLFVIEQM